MRPRMCAICLMLFVVAAVGCRNAGGLAQRDQWAQLQQQYVAQLQEVQRRANSLDANNADLHQQLARSEQNVRLLQQDLSLVRNQLADTTNKLVATESTNALNQERLAMLEASTRRRGGATITANSSLRREMEALNVPGLVVRHENNSLKIELPVDRLFQSGTPNLTSSSYAIVDQVAVAVKTHYPNEAILIEGHTDSDPVAGPYGDNMQLSGAQANAVFQVLVSRHGMAAQRFQVLSKGGTQPVVSNGTPQGKARNRRVELVIQTTSPQ